MGARVSRRAVVKAAAATAAGVLVVPSSRVAFSFAANERFGLAVLGHMYVAAHFFSSIHGYRGVELVALAHPDRRKLDEGTKVWRENAARLEGRAAGVYARLLEKRPPVYADFRKMLEERGRDIDGLVVSVFDHYHGVACGAAMRAGKHVFCERPLGLTVSDARALRELAAKTKVATAIRNPGNAGNAFRRGVELICEGLLGPVEEVHVWFDRPGADLRAVPAGTPPVPEGLDWDLWLGPARARPYHPEWMAYSLWREFSNGGIGTFGPHATNLALAGLNVHELWPGESGRPAIRGTVRVEAEVPDVNRLSFPKWEVVRWKVPARGAMPAVTFTWHHGPGLSPGSKEKIAKLMTDRGADAEEATKLMGYAGAIVVGTKGALVADDHNVKVTLLPKATFADVDLNRLKALPASRGHYHDWFAAARGGPPAWSNFTYAAALSEFLMLGNVATQVKGALEYDPAAGKVVNSAEADRLLAWEYRKGWEI